MSIDDLVTLVSVGLSNGSVSACNLGDLNHDGQITVNEIITAVTFALAGCR